VIQSDSVFHTDIQQQSTLLKYNIHPYLHPAAAMALSQMQRLQQQISSTPSSSRHNCPLLLRPNRHTNPCSVTSSRSQVNSSRGLPVCRAVEEQQQQQSVAVQPEAAVPGMSAYLDSLKWSKDGLVPVIVQVCAAQGVYSSTGHQQQGTKHQPWAQPGTWLAHACIAGHMYLSLLSDHFPSAITGNCLLLLLLQHVDTGELLMQAYADRAALSETLQTK
jgi:phosphoribosyl-AMP cyclohydrolase